MNDNSINLESLLADIDVSFLATTSMDCIPNVVPIRFTFFIDSQTLWLVDNFFDKTLLNLKSNPNAALAFWNPKENKALQLKGTVEIQNQGSLWEQMRARVHSTRPDLPARSLVIFNIAAIYQCLPGPEAGQLIVKY